MISLIIKSYLVIFLSIGLGLIFILILGLYFIFKFHNPSLNTPQAKPVIKPEAHPELPTHDVSAIAGDDPLATQLDLARAYIETGKNQSAKKILEFVAEQGNTLQQVEAKDLLKFI